jgi:SAM-dependent methyltransferase
MKTYQKLCTEFYDLEPHRDGTISAVFYLQRAMQAHGSILEPMCGTGRFLIPMLEAGLDVQGFDASSYMLDALKKKYTRISSKQPPVWQQFVQDFLSERRYQLIFVPYGSWGLITDLEDSKKCLASMYNHLAVGGKFIIEIETVASVPQPCGIWRRGVHTRADGSKIAINTKASYDKDSQIFQSLCHYESIVQGVVDCLEIEDFKMYLYHFEEMDQLLRDVGFSDITKYQDYNLSPVVDLAAHIIIYECVK